MSQPSSKIPLNKQNARAIGGLEVNYISYDKSIPLTDTLGSHRDDYYVLALLIKGKAILQCDMEKIVATPDSILLVRPYQVHAAATISKRAEAYFLTIAPFLMPDHCRDIFHRVSIAQQCLKIPEHEKTILIDTASLLYHSFIDANTHKTFITNGLLSALIYRIAALFLDVEKHVPAPTNQPALITQKFKQFVTRHSFSHTPSFFSQQLNITTAHLNDCVKSVTGLSVTAYLQEAMLLEAKRYLYYTNDDVKTIAFALGFDDHTYFSRMFKKLTRETPLSFRRKFRE